MKYKLAIVLSGICLGLIGPITKMIDGAVPLMTLNFFRMFFAFLFMLIIAPLIIRKAFKINKAVMKENAITGILMAVAFSIFVWANLEAPVSNVALINSLYVIFVGIIAFFVLKEKITKNQLIAIVVAIIGMVVLNPLAPEYLFGNFLALIQAILFAFLIISMRHEEKYHRIGVESVMWFFFFASIILSPFLIFGLGNVMSVLPLLIILGVVSTGIAYSLFFYGLRGCSADLAAILSLVTFPTSSIIFAIILLNEVMTTELVIGGVLLIVAGMITVSKDLRRRL